MADRNASLTKRRQGSSCAEGVRAIVPVSGTAYGDAGGGIPGLLLGSPRDEAGNLIMIGEGRQHVLTPTVPELTEAAALAVGAPGAVSGSQAEARSRLGDYFAEVLLLDQGTQAARARVELGWKPTHLRLDEEFRVGSYRK